MLLPLTREAQLRINMESPAAYRLFGKKVSHVSYNMLGEKLGIKVGDILIAVDGESVCNKHLFTGRDNSSKDNMAHTITVLRENYTFSIDSESLNLGLEFTEGIHISDVNFRMGDEARQLMVFEVPKGSYGAKIGFREKDKIVSANSQPVCTESDLEYEIEKASNGFVQYVVCRGSGCLRISGTSAKLELILKSVQSSTEEPGADTAHNLACSEGRPRIPQKVSQKFEWDLFLLFMFLIGCFIIYSN